jgi:alkanesulfonate monooxygenase SsuD/methylene tetrahydromethanopterin reductase-like flavin-dependent oxidoreductase (luciferase family)
MTAATEIWLHAFALPGRVADLARRAEAWGFTGMLLADSQNLTADKSTASRSPARPARCETASMPSPPAGSDG